MRWLSDNGIQLNVCPSSNVVLGRVESMEKHPIRVLYDNGVKVTVNSDDLTIFGQSVSDEYLNLHRAGVMSGGELDEIRRVGLEG
jgi:adenosine deaminase